MDSGGIRNGRLQVYKHLESIINYLSLLVIRLSGTKIPDVFDCFFWLDFFSGFVECFDHQI